MCGPEHKFAGPTAQRRVRSCLGVLRYKLPIYQYTYIPIYGLYLYTCILRSLILGAPWGSKIAKGYPCRTLEVPLAALGRPKAWFFRFFDAPERHQNTMTFQHRPKTSQNDLTIDFWPPKGRFWGQKTILLVAVLAWIFEKFRKRWMTKKHCIYSVFRVFSSIKVS